MTDLTTTPRPTSQTAGGSAPAPVPAAPTRESALITEQQVMFGTAAAATPLRTRRWATALESAAAAARAVFAAPQEPARRHYPKRYAYLENAVMAREMHRL
jgi:hypothetical protein